MTCFAHGNGFFFHRFQQCRLRLGCSAIYFVGQYDVRENGPWLKLEDLLLTALLNDICPVMSAGMRSGVNWIRENFRCITALSVEQASFSRGPARPRAGHDYWREGS